MILILIELIIFVIVYFSLIFFLEKKGLFDRIDLYMVYFHEKGHQLIFSLFKIRSKVENIEIIKKPIRKVVGECNPIGEYKMTIFKIYLLEFINFIWDLIWIFYGNSSWLKIKSEINELNETIHKARGKSIVL